ncbi:MAG TPA: type VI secretion system tube protein TssD [Edaphobacter sp.]|nr:type VI secretion system tube protein TssD [Edaphobacter sp.]
MATQFYATVTGAKQGAFKGETTQKGREGKILGVAFSYGVLSPHAVSSGAGQATGKRQHQPVVFTKEWGASSPQFYQAAFTNETLTSVLFEFIVTNRDGTQQVDHTIKLTNASIIAVRQTLPDSQPAGSLVDPRELQEISFTFQKIEIVSLTGGTQTTDESSTNV